jgi:hypothetical protein
LPAIWGISQQYHKLIRPNTYWDCTTLITSGPGPNGCANTMDRIFFTEADTVLQGVTYMISYAYPMHSDPPDFWNCPPYVIDTVAVDHQYYIREDTLARKVYIYYPMLLSSDILLYDFTLQPGDTLKSAYQELWTGPTIITAVDSVLIGNGGYRKRYICETQSFSAGYYIEGVGGCQGLFTPIITFEWGGHFMCLKENNIALWGDQCDYGFVGSPEKTNQDPKIYPNPASTMVNIQFPGDDHLEMTIEMFDMRGVKMKEVQSTGNNLVLNIEDFPAGMYFIKITTNNVIMVKKICKD